MGWSMNDLRSVNRTLAPVRTLGPRTGEIVSAPPGSSGGKNRKGRKPNPLFQGSRPDLDARRRPRSAEPTSLDGPKAVDSVGDVDDVGEAEEIPDVFEIDEGPTEAADPGEPGDPLTFQVSRQLRSMAVTALPEADDEIASSDGPSARRSSAASNGDTDRAPASRPARRREVVDDDELAVEIGADTDAERGTPVDDEDDKFPWHYQFDDDEPQELQAKSPLLSRAFRSSVG